MKIFYVNVIEVNKGWGAEEFINKGFKNSGNETITLDYRANKYNLASKFLEVSDFDVLFLQRGDGFPLSLLRAVQRPKFFFASEMVERCRDQDRLFKANIFDHIFVHTSRCKQLLKEYNWVEEDKVSVLLNGFDESVHYPMNNVKKDIDVLFIGNITERRKEYLKYLSEKINIYEGHAFGKEMVQLVNRAKIVINIHAEDFLDIETRVFEVLGCKTLLLTEPLAQDNPFEKGKHYVECLNKSDMIKKIKYYLKNEIEANTIADAGYKEAIKKHTYLNRAEEIVIKFKKYVNDDLEGSKPINYCDVRKYKSIESIKRFLNKISIKRKYV